MNRFRLAVAIVLATAVPASAQEKKELRWGTDPTGGAPYIFKPPGSGDDAPFVGFEVELAEYLAKKLGRTSVPVDGLWKSLPELLDKPRDGDKGVDIVLNGYEDRDDLKEKYAATVPYYVYRLSLIARKDDAEATDWPSLRGKPNVQVGVLGESAAAVSPKSSSATRPYPKATTWRMSSAW